MTTCYPNLTSCVPTDSFCIGDNIFRLAFPGNELFGDLSFKAFGTMGIRNYAGEEKSQVFSFWQQTFQLPLLSNNSQSKSHFLVESISTLFICVIYLLLI
jgi:hypothetical protein